jgi:death-on-curing protein
VKLLEVDVIFAIHENQIQQYGGDSSHYIYSRERVESIVSQQYPLFGYDKYPTIHLKAAMLMVFITKGHCFVDGNKRTGLASALVFLTINGYTGQVGNQEVYDKTMEIACAEFNNDSIDEYVKELADWLAERFS